MKEKGSLLIIVIIVGLVAISATATAYYFSQQNKTMPESKTAINTPTTIPTITTIPSPTPVKLSLSESAQTLNSELMIIFKGEAKFSEYPGAGVATYSRIVTFPYTPSKDITQIAEVSIYVIKYKSGQIMKGAYEGFEWTVPMDAWVDYLTNIKVGQTKAKRVTAWGQDDIESPILVKQLGGRIYGIFDSFFKPSGTYSREYSTYDDVNKQVITIYVQKSFIEGVRMPKDSALFEFPKEHLDFLNEVEKVISSAQ